MVDRTEGEGQAGGSGDRSLCPGTASAGSLAQASEFLMAESDTAKLTLVKLLRTVRVEELGTKEVWSLPSLVCRAMVGLA